MAQLTQPKGMVSKETNKEAIARVFGLRKRQVGYLSTSNPVDSYTILYDEDTQTCWYRGSATGTPVSWSISGQNLTLITGSGTFTLTVASKDLVVPFNDYLVKNNFNTDLAIREAAASGVTVKFTADKTYTITTGDIPFARYTRFIGPEGSYATFLITGTSAIYGTFDIRSSNSLNGGRYNTFANLSFRYPNQVTTLDATNTAPVVYPPLFHGGCYESRFENLDIGNAYYGFRLGGTLNGVDLGTASRVRLKDIIGAPLYRGISLEQVRDVPVIENIRWNYNYLDGGVYGYSSTLKQWMHDNAWAFHFGRLDWSVITNLFAYGYLRTFVLLSSRYTGSADRLRFVGCTADHCVFPVYLQNFSNRVDFIGCGFTGDYGSEFTRISPNQMYINYVGDTNAEVCFAQCTVNNFSGGCFWTGTNLSLDNTHVWDFGYDSTASNIRNGIILTHDNVKVSLNQSRIDASAGSYSRCIYDGGFDNNILSITGGSFLTGATLENFRWNGGSSNREEISTDSTVVGLTSSINSRGFLSFYNHRKVYESTSIPTTGDFTQGDFIKNTNPALLSETITISSGVTFVHRYYIAGWMRMTTGSSHTVGTDWVNSKVTVSLTTT